MSYQYIENLSANLIRVSGVDEGNPDSVVNKGWVENHTESSLTGGTLPVSPTQLTVTGTTASSSSTTGSAVFAGGVGIAKNLYVGGSGLTFSGNTPSITCSGTTGPFNIDPNYGSNNYVRIFDELRVQGHLKVVDNTGTVNWISVDGTSGLVTSVTTTNSTSSTSGAVVLAGGVGIAKSLHVGTSITVAGNQVATVNQLPSAYTAGTNLSLSANQFSVISNPTFSGATTLAGMTATTGSFSSTLDVTGATTVTNISSTDTTDSSSISTGALKASGGVGITKSLYVGGSIISTLTTNATSISTGSMIVSGGVAVAKDMYLGGKVWYTGNTPSITCSGTTGPFDIDPNYGSNNYVRIFDELRVQGNLKVVDNTATVNWISIDGTTGLVTSATTTNSTSSTSGAVVLAGGVGIAKKLYVGSDFQCVNANITGTLTASTVSLPNTNQFVTSTNVNGGLDSTLSLTSNIYDQFLVKNNTQPILTILQNGVTTILGNLNIKQALQLLSTDDGTLHASISLTGTSSNQQMNYINNSTVARHVFWQAYGGTELLHINQTNAIFGVQPQTTTTPSANNDLTTVGYVGLSSGSATPTLYHVSAATFTYPGTNICKWDKTGKLVRVRLITYFNLTGGSGTTGGIRFTFPGGMPAIKYDANGYSLKTCTVTNMDGVTDNTTAEGATRYQWVGWLNQSASDSTGTSAIQFHPIKSDTLYNYTAQNWASVSTRFISCDFSYATI